MVSRGPAKTPFWEKQKKQKGKKSLFRYLVLLIFLIVLVNLAFKIPSLLNSLNTPFQKDDADRGKAEKLDTIFRVNLVLISTSDQVLEDAALVSYDPVGKQLSSAAFGLTGNETLRQQFRTSFSQSGALAVVQLVSQNLSVFVDRYVSVEGWGKLGREQLTKIKEDLSSLLVLPSYLLGKEKLQSVVRTNLTTTESWDLFWKVRGAKFESSSTREFSSISVQSLPSVEASSLLENMFLDEAILEEGVSVTIVNSSGHEGLGAILAGFVSNMGATVVGLSSSEESVSESKLLIKNEKKLFKKRIKQLLTVKEEHSGEDFAGDIQIILGEKAIGELTF